MKNFSGETNSSIRGSCIDNLSRGINSSIRDSLTNETTDNRKMYNGTTTPNFAIQIPRVSSITRSENISAKHAQCLVDTINKSNSSTACHPTFYWNAGSGEKYVQSEHVVQQASTQGPNILNNRRSTETARSDKTTEQDKSMDGRGFIEQDGGSRTNSRTTLQENDSKNLGHTNHRDFHTSSQYSNLCSRKQQYEATHATTGMAVSQSQLPGSSYSVRLMHQAYSPWRNIASSQMYSENT